MATKQVKPGYVYILTNPSFREDWVKIGKSSRPVDVRSKELDNTAVPLPFEVYATMKTVKYNEAERLVHKYIERFTNLRIRNNREFFNVKPEEALEIFKDVAMVIDDVEIEFAKNIDKPVIHRERVTPQVISQTNQPTIWLIPSNSNYFDLKACYKDRGQVYWTIKNNFKSVKAGDRGYIYSSSPDKAILYNFDVVKAHIPYSAEMETEDKYEKREIIDDGGENAYDYALLKLEEITTPKKLSLERLIENGLTSAPQAAMVLSQKRFEKLLIYIEETTTSVVGRKNTLDTQHTNVGRTDSEKYYYGLWKSFLEDYLPNNPSKLFRIPNAKYYWDSFISIPIGKSNVTIYLIYRLTTHKATVQLSLRDDLDKKQFDRLIQYKDKAEKQIGHPLVWRRDDGRKNSLVDLNRNCNLDNPSEREATFSWYKEYTERFIEFFKPIIENL